jgi:acyl-CoA synthetase (AMP-forming)/AMP-acid ligase II
MIVGDVIRRNASRYATRTAYVCGDRSITFGAFNERVNRLANALAGSRLRRGERVALLLPTGIDLLEAYGACEKLGLIAVPMNMRLHAREVALILSDCEPAAMLYDARFPAIVPVAGEQPASLRLIASVNGAPLERGTLDYDTLLSNAATAEPDAAALAEDPLYLYYTSGTTGTPKGVLQTHRSALNNARRYLIDLEVRHDDVPVASSPLFHIGGRSMAFNYFYRGCTQYMLQDFDADEFLRIAARASATSLGCVPTTLKMILDSPECKRADLRAVRSVFYSGSPAAAPVLRAITDRFGNVLQQVYGMSETGPMITVLGREDHARAIERGDDQRLLSCGRPALDVEVRVVDEGDHDVAPGGVGEVIIRSDSLMTGYWRLPELTETAMRGGWLHSGDVGTWDDEGFLTLVDRKKEMIVSGAENVYPREVENVLYAHPAIAEVAVVGVPDERWGETVLAIIVPVSGAQLTAADVTAFCSERLAGYKKPRRIEFVAALPHNSIGKIDKKTLRQRYWATEARNIG